MPTWRQKSAETCLVQHIDESLGIFSREISDHLNLIVVQKDCHDQRDPLIYGGGMTDQPFPGWDLTAHEEAVELTNV